MKHWLSILIGFFYILFGIFVIVKQSFGVPLEPQIAYGLGAVLIVYGIFRIARSWIQNKNNEI